MAAPSNLTQNENTESVLTVPKLTTIETVGGILCHICRLTFRDKKDYDAHYLKMNHGNDKTKFQYTCVACDKTYTGYPTFRSHCYVQHVLKDKFKCAHCSKCFPKVSYLNEHVSALHNFQCIQKKCKKTFASKAELHHHQLLHKSALHKSPYTCRACRCPIHNADDCETHIDEHAAMSYQCPMCNEEITKDNATKHLSNHFGHNNDDTLQEITSKSYDKTDTPIDSSISIVGGILCCHCQGLFKDKLEIVLHFKAEHRGHDVVYTCIVCKKQYDKYSLFGNHCYSHCSKNRFECDKCSKPFPRLSLLVRHTETYHEVPKSEAKPFACLHCDRRFSSERKRQEHTRVKHEDCQWRCTEDGCEQSFETPKDLLLHRKRHTTHTNWCRTCGMQFDSLASCLKHLDLHKKKLFACPICSKQTNEKYYIMKHVPKHFATVFHMCKICGKTYNEKRRLIQHTKIHANVKKYLCTYCGKSFAKSSHMTQHINIHTGAKPYKCVACPKTFASYPNWNKHLKRIHKIDAKTVKKPEKTNEVIPKSFYSENLKGDGYLVIDETIRNEFDDDSMDSDSDSTIVDEINAIESFLFDSESDAAEIPAVNNEPATDGAENNKEPVSEADDNVCSIEIIPPVSSTDMQIMEELLDDGVLPEAAQPVAVDAPPMEYGPDFVNADLTTVELRPGKLIQLDDHLLPHIDPLLTIKCTQDPQNGGANHPVPWDTFNHAYFDISNKTDVSQPNLVWGPTAIEVYSCFNNEMKPVCRSSVM